MSLSTNWRTINIDALDPESPANFDLASLAPSVAPTSAAECQQTAQQIRQLLRGGDSEGALRGALDTAPYGADERGKVCQLYCTFLQSPWAMERAVVSLCWVGVAPRHGCSIGGVMEA
jgi:ARP2/3 complex 16 kDa subunit (p16-Arc)